MRNWGWGAAVLALAAAIPASADAAANADDEATAKRFLASLHPQTGDVAIPAAKAVLHLGKDYYFLPADDAKRVLTEAWSNPADGVSDVLGMVLPADKTALDNVWGAVITYHDTGYVPDQDASTQDYNKVLEDARAGEADENAARKKDGYPAIHLVGWAQPPAYDPTTHSLIWARDLAFEGGKVDTLNYDVRLLGRKGVLSLNMVSDMQHLGEVRAAAQQFGRTAAFQPGATYGDFNASVDKTAEYGLAGLVAAGVGVVAVKKLGLLALLLAFGKKALVLIAIGAAAAWRFVKRLFGRRPDPDAL